jgi:hypothetical protein
MTVRPTNRDRARRAGNALTVFAAETLSGDDPDTPDRADLEAAISHLICDLLHLAEQHGFDPHVVVEWGYANFEAELLLDD